MRNIFFILILSVAGCSFLGRVQKKDADSVAQIWINQTAAIEVEEVYSNEREVYIKFQAILKDGDFHKDFYCRAIWDSSDVDLTKNLIVPMQFMDRQAWENRGVDLAPVRSLSVDHWKDLRLKLASQIAPSEGKKGAVIRSDEDELILYYDEAGELQVMDVKDKPADVEIKEFLSQTQLSQKVQQALQDYLQLQKIPARQALLTLTNEDDYANPFLYVDLDRGITVGLKIIHKGKKYKENLFAKSLKSADHLVFDNLVLGVITRPVSTAYRLFSWAKETTYEVVNPGPFDWFGNVRIPPVSDSPGMDLNAFEEKLNSLVGRNVSNGTLDFYIGGDEFFPRLIDALIGAQRSILMRIFIFDNDDYAVGIADLLKRKSKKNKMDVKILLDGTGQIMGEGKIPETLPEGFTPPASMKSYLKKNSKISVRVRTNPLFKTDHVKTIIIDKKVCFTGGMNIGREYRYDWHDLMMELRGPIVNEILKEFKIAWAHASPWGDLGYLRQMMKKSKRDSGQEGYPIRLLYTRVDDPQIYKAQLAAIREAKRYIYIHNSYFSDNTILRELIRARYRGVDVRVILPVNGNHEIMNASNVVTANIMFRRGIKVYFYPGMSHIKAAIYDGWLCTGSANFDKLSFRDNLEFNIATSNPSTVEDLKKRLFEKDFEKSLLMTEPLQAGWKERLAEFLAEQL